MTDSRRGQMNPIDLVLGFATLLVLLVTSPIWYRFADLISSEAGPLTSIILAGTLPLLFLLIMFSVGASARRRLG